MNTGWIKLYRKSFDNKLYFAEPFTRWQAWCDLLLLANTKSGSFIKRGIKVDVEPGQVGHDIDTLAQRWRWSRGKVNRFISVLETEHQVVRQKSNVTTLISIANWATYQPDSRANGRANDIPDGHQTNMNKNNKKKEKERTSDFSNFSNEQQPRRISAAELIQRNLKS